MKIRQIDEIEVLTNEAIVSGIELSDLSNKEVRGLVGLIRHLQSEHKKHREALEKIIKVESKPNLKNHKIAIKLCSDFARQALGEEKE